MSREIKFRIYKGYNLRESPWMKDEKGMVYLTLDSMQGGFYWSEEDDTEYSFGREDRNRVPIMQYTGLKCNGYEWYDGDILENDGDWYVITWDEDQASWEATGIRSTGESLSLCELLSQETWVQGNIYQNPELIQDHA